MKHCYTVSTQDASSNLFDIVQVMLSYRQSSKIKEAAVEKICKSRPKPFLVHWDYVNLPTKWLLFTKEKRESILYTLNNLGKLQSKYPQFLGLVMHTTSSVSGNFKTREQFLKLYENKYATPLYSPEEVYDKYVVDGKFNHLQFQIDSLTAFCRDFQGSLRIWFENNTRSINNYFVLDNLVDFLRSQDITRYGVCYDTEHEYAQTGKEFNDISAVCSTIDVPFIVHYNVIPNSVTPRSRVDLHSDNTIDECSVYSFTNHLRNLNWLSDNNIPFVRELNYDVILREEKLLDSYLNRIH